MYDKPYINNISLNYVTSVCLLNVPPSFDIIYALFYNYFHGYIILRTITIANVGKYIEYKQWNRTWDIYWFTVYEKYGIVAC